LQQGITVNVENPISFNCHNKLSDSNIPYGQLNNLSAFDEKASLFPDYTGDIETNYHRSSNSNNQNLFTKKQLATFSDAVKGNDIILFINKPTGFNSTVKETIYNNGKFKLLNSEDYTIYSKDNIIDNLYNVNVVDYLLSKNYFRPSNAENLKRFLLNYFNELPLELSDTEVFVKNN
jgi:hypothetical protein